MGERRFGILLPLVIVLVTLVAAAAGAYFLLSPKTTAERELENILSEYTAIVPEGLTGGDAVIAEGFEEIFDIEIQTDVVQGFRDASVLVKLSHLDVSAMCEGLAPMMQEYLTNAVNNARLYGEVYGDDGNYLPEVLEEAYCYALECRLENPDEYIRHINVRAELDYDGENWSLVNGNDFISFSALDYVPSPGFEEALGKLEIIDFSYELEDWTSPGPVPDAACYGETDDPAVITALLEQRSAKKLINGQELSWSPDIELIPGTTIKYYLDDTILTIVWQEEEHGAVGTFAETFIADASQLRRKIANDDFGSMAYYYPTQLAAEANAVLAVSGDFYDLPYRVYGLYVYNGKLMRSCLYAGESCMFDDKGNMIFTYANDFATEDEAQKFIDENNIMFSLSFGPVILDQGEDVVPFDYYLGEIRDTYARCCIGQLGELHYLAMTINVSNPDYPEYVTLRQAADSMIEHGAYNAYTLDGGQTGSIILGNELINPVQFGVEKEQSDIFYFATAIPNK